MRFSSYKIISSYNDLLSVDVSKYLDVEEIILKDHPVYGYSYFYPFHISGDSSFYEELSKKDWYYNPWKWEHDVALKNISFNDKILEIGCGKGSFISKLEQMGNHCVGLELGFSNPSNPTIFDQTIEHFSKTSSEKFDIICGFQILEHIVDVEGFLKSVLLCLNPNGKIIFSVPNNDSFIKDAGYSDPLNFPPHHMVRWNLNAFKKTAKYFGVELHSVHFEPLQLYHLDWFLKIKEDLIKKYSFFCYWLYFKFGFNKIFKYLISRFRRRIKGHSILVVLKKI